jgi:hypothetical protein
MSAAKECGPTRGARSISSVVAAGRPSLGREIPFWRFGQTPEFERPGAACPDRVEACGFYLAPELLAPPTGCVAFQLFRLHVARHIAALRAGLPDRGNRDAKDAKNNRPSSPGTPLRCMPG